MDRLEDSSVSRVARHKELKSNVIGSASYHAGLLNLRLEALRHVAAVYDTANPAVLVQFLVPTETEFRILSMEKR